MTRGLLLVVGLAALGCVVRPDEVSLSPEVVAPLPEVRIGLLTDASRVSLDSDLGLVIVDPDEGELVRVAAGTALRGSTRGSGIALDGGGERVTRRVLLVEPVEGGVITVDGKWYRGRMELRRSGERFQVINHIDLESYLLGVIRGEMGTRSANEFEALKAQAVAARTYTLRNLGRWSDQGFDLVAGVGAQVYLGSDRDDPLISDAVAATHGEVLQYDGVLIDAFYSSTCGGHTEDGVAAFVGASRPYLRSVSDLAPDGTAYCSISPRFTWRESWNAEQLTTILRRTLAAEKLPRARANDLRDLRPAARTASGRVAALDLVGSGGSTAVQGQSIRRVLSPEPGTWLRSTDFTIKVSRSGSRIERVTVEGRGNGHGVGMCQWGAIGRARAGQDYATILMSYFPGTELRRIY